MGLIRKIARTYGLLKLVNSSLAGMPELPRLRNLDELLSKYRRDPRGMPVSTLDIGCGTEPRNPFKATDVFGLDIRERQEKNIKYADLTLEPIPFADDTFDYITAYDFIEHVPRVIYLPQRRFPFVELMNEIWRALVPNGIFLSHTPIYPFSESFRDPTHVNILTHQTFPFYFDNEHKWAAMYGFRGSFAVLDQALAPPHLISILRKDERPDSSTHSVA